MLSEAVSRDRVTASATLSPYTAPKKAGERVVTAVKAVETEAMIKAAPKVTHTDAERVLAAFSTPLMGEEKTVSLRHSTTSESFFGLGLTVASLMPPQLGQSPWSLSLPPQLEQ